MPLKDNHDLFRNGDTDFHTGDPATQTPATIPTTEFLNSLQEEFTNIFTYLGLGLRDEPQLAKALEKIKYGT